MPVPDRSLVITEDQIPNLRNLLMLSRGSQSNSNESILGLVEEAKSILMDKLRRNLMSHIPN